MKNGYNEGLKEALARYGMSNYNVAGTVLEGDDWSARKLIELGYVVFEGGEPQGTDDFVFLSKAKSNLQNIIWGLTKVDNGCIIVFRVDSDKSGKQLLTTLYRLRRFIDMIEYDEGKYFAVIVKGML